MLASAQNPDLWVALVGLAGAVFVAAILAIAQNNGRERCLQARTRVGVTAIVIPGLASVVAITELARRAGAPNWVLVASITIVALTVESAALLHLSNGPNHVSSKDASRAPTLHDSP